MWTPSRRSSLALGLLVSAAGLCAAVTASSAPPEATAPASAAAAPSGSASPTSASSASATASGSASAAASGALDAGATGPLVRGADPPTATSDLPKNKEWESGKEVMPQREQGKPCKLKLVREWLRFECDGILGATLVGGEPADVKIVAGGGPFTGPDPERGWIADSPLTTPPPKTLITLRLRRGDTKVFSLLSATQDHAPYPFEAHYIAVVWPENREDPTLLISKNVR
jgi:hypothetical protein